MYFALVIFGDHIKTMKPRVLRGGDVLPECSFAYGNVFIRIKSKQTFIFYLFFFFCIMNTALDMCSELTYLGCVELIRNFIA